MIFIPKDAFENVAMVQNNYIYYKVWDEITYPFLNFNGATIEVSAWE